MSVWLEVCRGAVGIFVVAHAGGCGGPGAPVAAAKGTESSETPTVPVAPVATAEPTAAVGGPATIRWVAAGSGISTSGAYLCVRFIEGDLRCVGLKSTFPGFALSSLVPTVDGGGPMDGACIAGDKTVHCDVFDDEPTSHAFAFTPVQLATWLGAPRVAPNGVMRPGPVRVCARSRRGKVVCQDTGDGGSSSLLFDDSVELRGDFENLLSRRSDGTIECVGQTVCAMAALADQRSGAAHPRTMEDVEASWPGALDKPPPVEAPHVVAVPPARGIVSTNPACVELDDTTLACWDYTEGPRKLTVSDAKSWVSWGLHACTREGDDITCLPSREDDDEEKPLAFHVVGAERIVNVEGRLCAVTRTRSVTCFSDDGSLWGKHEASHTFDK